MKSKNLSASLIVISFLFPIKCLLAQAEPYSAPKGTLSRPLPKIGEDKNPTVILLDGTWKINPAPGKNFKVDPVSGPGWLNFNVPGQWAQQGFEIPDSVTTAIARDFKTPASWEGKRIILRFDAVHGGTDYWLNGKHLGYSENLFTPVEFDITDKITPGKTNHLVLSITLRTPSEKLSYSSDYAFHSLGGIDRSVRLIALPSNHISSIHYQTRLDSAYHHAILMVDTRINNGNKQGTIRISLIDPGGRKLPLSNNEFAFHPTASRETIVQKTLAIPNPLKWSAEKPTLYKMIVELLNSGKTVDQVEQSIGFRQVEVRGSELLVNGKPVKLSGVCRHELDPLTGRAATVKHAKEDAALFKNANFNLIRTSHYPPTKEFLDECDRIGLYVECEPPFCWVRGSVRGGDTALTKAFLTPTAAMIDYHSNHPSIIIWSIGNESGSVSDSVNTLFPNFEKTMELCRKMDPTRPIIFNNEWNKDGGKCDIGCLHYPAFPADKFPFLKDDNRPFLLDEYSPPQSWRLDEQQLNPGLDLMWTMGENSDTSWWNQLYYSKQALGGSIWAGIDEEFYFKDGRNSGFGPYVGYGPWGFADAWRRPKSIWWDAKLMFSPVWIPVRTVPYESGVKKVSIPIENRYSFTNLDEITISWEIGPVNGKTTINVPAKSNGEFSVPVPEGTPTGKLITLRFWDKKNQLISAHGVRLGARRERTIPALNGVPEWKDDGSNITVTYNGSSFSINRSSGKISSTNTRFFPLQSFPVFYCTRREDRNPFDVKGLPFAEYPDKSTFQIDAVHAENKSNALSVVFKTHDSLFTGDVELQIDKEGKGVISYNYIYTGAGLKLGETGVQFTMDKSCQEISWDRNSEWDVYPDEHIGRSKGHATALAKENSKNVFPPYLSKPSWGWRHDASKFGTADFRTSKYQIYEASLTTPAGAGIMALSNGRADMRACLSSNAVLLHLLESHRYERLALDSQYPGKLADKERKLVKGERLTGSFTIRFVK